MEDICVFKLLVTQDLPSIITSNFLVSCYLQHVMPNINLFGLILASMVPLAMMAFGQIQILHKIKNGAIDLPIPRPLPERDIPFPFVFVADEAFPLTTYLMRPYSRKNSSHFSIDIRIFNYRLSRCRRTIENTFGILTARWQILHKPLCMSLENSEMLFKTLVCLHNFVMMGEEELPTHIRRYCPPDYIDREENYVVQEGRWREQHSAYFKDLGRVGANRAGTVAEGLRNYLRDYFISSTGESQVPWQYEAALGTVRINPSAR